MQTLHLDLKTVKGDVVALRCFWDNPYEYVDRTLSLSAIAGLTRNAEETYYVSAKMREGLATIGQTLFNWLDGTDRWLVSRLGQYPGEVIVLAIAVAEGLAHLPWEVLHDGAQFLVQRYPAAVPVRWLSSDQVTQLALVSEPQNRALRVLFMATSPRSVEPVLDYEQEEAAILKVTARPSIGLVVEESGCLEELGYLVDSYGTESTGKRYFDVVHITGHATIAEGQPKFITETATGHAYYASPVEIARTLKTPLPPLLFLSGCRTGQAGNAGAVPSMAEQLLQAGATAVLGWGQNVLDTDATSGAAVLYEALARSNSLAEAVAFAYQKLIEQQARDWHLLRLYVAKTLPGQLVKPERTPGWQRAPRPSMATEFLDPLTKKIKVPTRESFVGRRRQLQNCLRSLTQSPDYLGVLIHGMAGLGKSSLAARLCDRLPQFKRLVWQGRIDSASLVKKLAEALDDANLRQRLIGQDEELKFRLRGVFTQLQAQGALPFLLILNDFEENLEVRGTGYVLKTLAADVLEALIWALQDSDPSHRLILTSRYDFEMQSPTVLYRQPMDALQGADLRKKCERLSALKPPELAPDATEADKQAASDTWQLQEQAKQLADGNPRLMETLNNEVLVKANIDRKARLQELMQDPTDLRKQIVEDQMLRQIEGELRTILSRGLVFEIPVPRETFEVVALGQNLLTKQEKEGRLAQAVALGVIEVSEFDLLRVPRILPLKVPENSNHLYRQAAECLYQMWWNQEKLLTEIQKIEIHRLSCLGQEEIIATDVCIFLSKNWNSKYKFDKTCKASEATLKVVKNHRVLYYLAKAEEGLRNIDKAVDYYRQALECRPEEDESSYFDILQGGVSLYARRGPLEQDVLTDFVPAYFGALQLQQESHGIRVEAATVFSTTMTFELCAVIALRRNQIEAAVAMFQYCLEFYDKVCDIPNKSHEKSKTDGLCGAKARLLAQLGAIYINQGNEEQGREFYSQAATFFTYAGDEHNKAVALATVGRSFLLQDKLIDALSYLEEASDIMKQLKMEELETIREFIAKAKERIKALLG